MDIIKVFRYDLAFGNAIHLPESIFDKVELWDLKNALNTLLPYIGLTLEEYEMIKDKITINIQIKVGSYYGNPSYYSVMPQPIFDALESATLNGEEFVLVGKMEFDQMNENYNLKMNKK